MIHRPGAGFWYQFWRAIDSDSVRVFIPFYYLFLLIASLYLGLFAYPIDLIVRPMGQLVYNAWVWLQLPATTMALGGLWLRHGGSAVADISNRLLFRDWMGLWMQLGGHACMCLVLTTFVLTAIVGAVWGQPIYGPIGYIAFVIGTFVLSLQCARKLRRGFQIERDGR